MSVERKEPVGELRLVGAEHRRKNPHAVFVRITFEDEKGGRFYFDASAFNFDLKLSAST